MFAAWVVCVVAMVTKFLRHHLLGKPNGKASSDEKLYLKVYYTSEGFPYNSGSGSSGSNTNININALVLICCCFYSNSL